MTKAKSSKEIKSETVTKYEEPEPVTEKITRVSLETLQALADRIAELEKRLDRQLLVR